jgi:thioredoxin reductase
MKVDAVVVGGSFAGLSAALQLARARQRVAVIDSGLRRNRFADVSHGFLGQDGRAPGDIVADAKAQLLAYPTVQWLSAVAGSATRTPSGFEVSAGDVVLATRRLVLATGVVDELPALPGLAERWGRSVFHCPYCHGFELDSGAIGVLASGPMSLHLAMLLPDWGRVTLFVNQAFEPDESQVQLLHGRGVSIETVPVAVIADHATVQLVDGRKLPFAGLFTLTSTRMSSPIAQLLGCDFDQGPSGPYIRRSEFMETTVSGVFACGDASRPFGNVATAVADGAIAGAFAHRSLIAGL